MISDEWNTAITQCYGSEGNAYFVRVGGGGIYDRTFRGVGVYLS